MPGDPIGPAVNSTALGDPLVKTLPDRRPVLESPLSRILGLNLLGFEVESGPGRTKLTLMMSPAANVPRSYRF